MRSRKRDATTHDAQQFVALRGAGANTLPWRTGSGRGSRRCDRLGTSRRESTPPVSRSARGLARRERCLSLPALAIRNASEATLRTPAGQPTAPPRGSPAFERAGPQHEAAACRCRLLERSVLTPPRSTLSNQDARVFHAGFVVSRPESQPDERIKSGEATKPGTL